MVYPHNGDRIVTIDSVTSLHPMYRVRAYCLGLRLLELGLGLVRLGLSVGIRLDY